MSYTYHESSHTINGIISKIPRGKKKIVKGSYESLERLEGKTGEGPFFKVRSDRITVCLGLEFGLGIYAAGVTLLWHFLDFTRKR